MLRLLVLFNMLLMSTLLYAKTTPVVDFVKQSLVAGVKNVNAIRPKQPSARMQELSDRMTQAIQDHKQWLADYVKNASPGKPLPYHANFGISKEEYREFLALTEKTEFEVALTEPVEIVYDGSTIRFKTEGQIQLFNFIQIDLDANQVLIDDYPLSYVDSVEVKSAKNAFGSAWNGYTWEFSNPKDPSTLNLADTQNLNLEYFTFTIGRVKKTGQIFLTIHGKVIQQGEKKADFSYTLALE